MSTVHSAQPTSYTHTLRITFADGVSGLNDIKKLGYRFALMARSWR